MRRLLSFLVIAVAGCGDGSKSTLTTTTDGSSSDTAAASSGAATTGTVTTGTTTTGPTTGTAVTTGESTGSLPDGACRTQADCQEFESCDRPGKAFCGGDTGCNLGGTACRSDPECGDAPDDPQICVPDPCCDLAFCQPGCLVAEDCGLGQACGPGARCVPASCDPQTPCPPNFSCEMNACAPTACDSDAQCDDFCVLGRCNASLGSCSAPAA